MLRCALFALPFFAFACAAPMTDEVIDSAESDDRVSDTWQLEGSGDATTAMVPIGDLGCPMGVAVTLNLDAGNANVDMTNVRYYRGYVDNYLRSDPDKRIEVYGSVFAGATDDTLSPAWFTIPGIGWDVGGNPQLKAYFMVSDARDYNIRESGCDPKRYNSGSQEIKGQPALEFALTLDEGQSATVSYDIEYFACDAGASYDDVAQQQVCDTAYAAMYESAGVGDTIEVSACPSFVDPRDCAAVDAFSQAVYGRRNTREEEITEDMVDDALAFECGQQKVLMSRTCC